VNITGKITGIKYKLLLSDEIREIEAGEFDINDVPTACVINDGKHSFAVSKWVSPKRTRSYPYERVYNTLNTSKKITVIPIVKDEGARGDRDFIQWDTISLMSLLDVYVIFGYFHKAEKKGEKISFQRFDNKYVMGKIKENEEYHSSALHWNLDEMKRNFQNILSKVVSSYGEIEKTTGVKLHGVSGLKNFETKIGKDVELFMEFSRGKAAQAQSREMVTRQPKENVSTLTKAKITITNYLGGNYFFTVDEIEIRKDKLFLIEGKHSANSLLPSKGDIKDGLLKMILYCNLVETKVDGKDMECRPVLELTSSLLKGGINSESKLKDIEKFLGENKLSLAQSAFIGVLFNEAKTNNFTINIKQDSIDRI
jgi:hypothetical protein